MRNRRLTRKAILALLTAAIYYRDDADPSREGDLENVTRDEWAALEQGIAALESRLGQKVEK